MRVGARLLKINNKVAWLLRLLIPIAVIFSLWLPPVAHYWVSVPKADNAIVDQLRKVAADNRLREIEEQALLSLQMKDGEVLQAAELLISGNLLLPGYPPVPISPRFSNADLIKGFPSWGLQYGSLVVPKIFLKAFEISGNPKWLTASLDFTRAFIRHEKSAWLPEGFLWNDHAIAGRVGVIIKLWRLYRNSQDYSEEIGQELISHILRCRALLGKKSHFTFMTNHGVMQNISLLQIRVAFPGLPEEESYLVLAVERLEKQLRFYMSDEGVVLEHSAEYHKFGFQLVGMAVRLLELLGEPVPQRWKELHKKSRDFLEVISLPDGELPMFGNTSSNLELVKDFLSGDLLTVEKNRCGHDRGMFLYPVSGYAVHWSCDSGQISQTVMALSFFQGHGHKHADELSILTWSNGMRWLTGVGYWPYGVPGEEIAYGWGGSNAPHWIGEQTNGERSSTIVSFAASNQLSFLDARRDNVDGSGFRRQVIQLGSALWVVLDIPHGNQGKDAEILWTFFPGISMTPKGSQNYHAVSGESSMWVNISGASIRDRLFSGERSPWLGWVVNNSVPSPADTLRLQFSGSQQEPVVSTFLLGRVNEALPVQTHLTHFQSPDDWEFRLQIGDMAASKSVRLVNDQISVSGLRGDKEVSLPVEKIGDVVVARKKIRTAYQETAAEYPRYREVNHYRLKLTKIFLVLFAINALFLMLVWAYWKRIYHVLRLASVGGWILLGLFSHLWYLP